MVFCNELHKIDNGIKSIFYMENKSMVYEIKIYEEQLKSDVIEFYKNVLPESGRELDLNGKHTVFRDIQNNYEVFWCLFCDSHLIGTVAVKRLNEKTCELKSLYLYADFHGKGLGYTLLEKAVEYAKEMNYEKMCLDTLSTSKKAIKLYKAAGFKEIVRYNDNMTADVFMEKDL